MVEPPPPTLPHHEFHSYCADIEDFEPLPEVFPGHKQPVQTMPATDHIESIDAEIYSTLLAGS